MAGKKRVPRYRKKHKGRFGVVLALVVILLILSVVGIRSIKLSEEREEILAKKAHYQELIEQEQQRTSELEEFEKYTHTKKYAEEVAKEKLGYVKDGEILFVAE